MASSLINKQQALQLFCTGIFILLTLQFHSNVLAQAAKAADIHVGLVYPISNHGSHAREYSNVFSLHALSGVSGGEKGLCLCGLSNLVYGNTNGLQVAGISNHIKLNSNGILLAGILNTSKSAKGVQVAGVTNIVRGSITGTQIAGVFNKSHDFKGIQIAGAVNLNDKNTNALQMAGLMNKSEDLKGVQVAGLLNKAKKVKGVQISGLINIADSSDYSVALLNFIKNGEKNIGVSIDESQNLLLSFRSGGRVIYGIIGSGYNLKIERDTWAFEGGLGVHLFRRNEFQLNVETAGLVLEDFKKGYYTKSSLRILPSYKLGHRLVIMGGPTLNYVETNTEDGRNLTDKYIWSKHKADKLKGVFAGFSAGIYFTL